MARRRMIDPHFWESGDINKLDIFARYIFISMFSHADDEGRGIGGAAYIRSITFPFENISIAKIKKAIDAIGECCDVRYYEVDGTEYYQLSNWTKWQRVDKPQESLLPTYSENDSKNGSENDSGVKEKKIKEEKEREYNSARARFIKPTLEEVKAYCDERKNGIDPEAFIAHYDSNGWMVGRTPMKSWKSAIITWEKNNKKNGNASSQKKGYFDHPTENYDHLAVDPFADEI